MLYQTAHTFLKIRTRPTLVYYLLQAVQSGFTLLRTAPNGLFIYMHTEETTGYLLYTNTGTWHGQYWPFWVLFTWRGDIRPQPPSFQASQLANHSVSHYFPLAAGEESLPLSDDCVLQYCGRMQHQTPYAVICFWFFFCASTVMRSLALKTKQNDRWLCWCSAKCRAWTMQLERGRRPTITSQWGVWKKQKKNNPRPKTETPVYTLLTKKLPDIIVSI